ncbi:right-handed parallel beta-helix repeat-containing protein [Carboxylicivirga marina]|uniref:Right-handed parallel beta-helix repeat-containing protein n=1 Tax=Carboxylicivirga marina TaxID=2800988 RepID=A0ABS1HEQ6_9BACT|nr:right-handed parallel beta-helix repeat-containing protein [Carboxylicivirga marina]MBK3516160.1 right-handed parallel beta-helix repeat-containing protein [Carboxylicivirga marina]
MTKKLTILITALFLSLPLWATTYYIDAINGNDTNTGLSAKAAFKSLKHANTLRLQSGDKILLANGQSFSGTLELKNVIGTKRKPIIISNFSLIKTDKNTLPAINAQGHRNGILLLNCSHIQVSHLEITADAGGMPGATGSKNDMRCGVLITCDKVADYENISLSDLHIKDVFYADKDVVRSKKETNSANGTQAYGWGIRLINRTKGAVLKNMKVSNCHVENVGHTGIKATGSKHSIQDLKLYDNTVTHTGGPGMQMSGILNGHVKGNTVTYSGSTTDTRKWGRGSGLWTWGCSTVLIEHNEFRFANGPADSAGCHIDFNCDNVIVQYNVSEGNAGGFCEILGNNYNCAYRYNISINDGHRVKKVNGAFQEGKIFWLSGFNGKGRKRNGPFNSYFYNNTIYVKSDIEAKIAVDRAAAGALLANNIFYIEGSSKLVLGDQYKPEVAGESLVKNIVFKNNLFLNANNWPKEVLIQDEAPVIGDAQFAKVGGSTVEDYIPQNISLIKDKGIPIPNIPGDDKGLYIGLKVTSDILGNKINGLPDMGAIEIKE